MKNFKLLAAVAAMTLATTASAQFANTSGGRISNGGGTSLVTDIPNYSRFSMDYSGVNTKTTYSYGSESGSADSDKEHNLKGFNLNYISGIGLKEGLPVFLEIGGQLAFNTEEEDDVRSNLLSIAIPIDLTYRLQLESGFYVAPYLGMRLKGNLLGNSKYSGSYSYSGDTVNWFDEDDMGEDMAFRRFQVGGIAGVNIGYKKVNFNVGYQFDSPLWSYSEHGVKGKMKTNGIVAGIGLNF